MKPSYNRPKYPNQPNNMDYQSNVSPWASTARQQGGFSAANTAPTSWMDNSRSYDYSTYPARDVPAAPVRDTYSYNHSVYYDPVPRAPSPPPQAAYHDSAQRYDSYRSPLEPLVPPASAYGRPMQAPIYNQPQRYVPSSSYFASQRGGYPPQRSNAGPHGNMRQRGVYKKRPQNQQGFASNKRVQGEIKKAFTNDDKKKIGTAGKAVAVSSINKDKPASGNADAPTSGTPAKDEKTATKQSANGKQDANASQKKERLLPKAVMDDLDGFIEQSKTMGETRRRQVRYKMFRLFASQNLDYVTSIEQIGTYAKRGQLRMKVSMKNFFPQFFVGECSGVDYEDASYECTVLLMLKMHKLGLLPLECIANFYEKKPHYKHSLFERAKLIFEALVEEVNKNDFTVAYKEGKCESADQTALLTTCIERVAERVRNNELPPVVETGAKTAAAEEDEDQNAGDESGAHADESAMGTSTVDAAPAQAAASEAPETADTNVTSIKEEPMAAEAQSEAPAATDEPIAETAESADQPAEPQSAGQT